MASMALLGAMHTFHTVPITSPTSNSLFILLPEMLLSANMRDIVTPEFLQIALYLFVKFFFCIFSLICLSKPSWYTISPLPEQRGDLQHFLIQTINEEKPAVDLLDMS